MTDRMTDLAALLEAECNGLLDGEQITWLAANLAAAGVTAPQPAETVSSGNGIDAQHLGPDDHGHTGRLWCDPCVGHGVMLEQGGHRCKPAPALDVERLRAAAQAYLDAEEALDTWDVAHGYAINSERDRLDGVKSEAREAMRAALAEAERQARIAAQESDR